ncbi:MAG: class I SAM-dependent methyltransferase, partial [Phycisphaeraceae bacterium]|nr:class I SAM-dependent methyltransferase [Phycisphaeraceae bacterium]
MRSEEYAALERLLRDVRPRTTLEIGMATGGSSIEICKTLRDVGGETHVAIDPYQSDPDGWNNQGINNVKAAGFDGLLEPIADFDYLALPKLVEQGRRFDFVLIDGWHSFDYTLVDLFYADLLLNVDGVVAIHDTGWPAVHREGYPDLTGLEIDFYRSVVTFNAQSRAIKVVFVNQFGWSRDRCGARMPEDMEFMDIRKGSDVEFGMSVYEPFGIAQVEPLSFGAICLISNVCGCAGFVERA